MDGACRLPDAVVPPPPARRAVLGLLPVVLLGALAACGSTPPAPGDRGRASPSGRPSAPTRTPLETEQKWLQAWFKDTPVLIAPRGDDALAVEVPREFCFDGGRAQVKPALAAVLDKVAESLRRQPRLRLATLAAPGDANRAELAGTRAANVRQHLRARGVPEARLASPSTGTLAAVQLRLQLLDEPH